MTSESEPLRVLVVYYSRSGRTQQIAQGLARAAEADLEAIEDFRQRTGIWGYLRSGYEATFGREAPIRAPRHVPGDYNLVLIGSPTWNSALPSPVRAYLLRFAGRLPDLAFFVTCADRGADRVVQQMTEAAGKKPLAALTLRHRDLKGRFPVYLAEFWESVLKVRESRPAPPLPARIAGLPSNSPGA